MIEVEDLKFSYGEEEVLKGISFELHPREFVGISGTTGSGKTTLALCLNGLIPNSVEGRFSGDVRIYGRSTKKTRVSELAKIVSLVFQNPDWQIFNPTVWEEVEFGVKNLGLDSPEERIENALKSVGLYRFRKKDPYNLSQGQKQKLCLATSLALESKITVVDEATSNLDWKNTRSIHDILKSMNEEGKTILAIGHDTDILAEYAKRIIIMDDGEIVEDGEPDEVFRKKELLENIGIKVPHKYR